MEQITTSSTESAPKSKTAFVALVSSFSAILFCGATIAIDFIFAEYVHYGPAGLIALCTSGLGILAPLIGIVMGGVALLRGEANRTAAIVAILLGIMAMIATGFIGFFTLMICCAPM